MFAPLVIYLLAKLDSLISSIKLFFHPKPPESKEEEWDDFKSRQF